MRTLFLGAALALGLVSSSAVAQGQPTLSAVSIPWSNTNAISVGTGIDVDLIDQQRGTCLAQTAADVGWMDNAGAAHTLSSMELVSTYQALTKTLSLEVDYKSKADLDIGALKAGGSLNLNLKYDTFAKDESRTLAIVLKAWSDYGRKGLSKYSLDTVSEKLVTDGSYEEFRARCGTHTVVAQHNEAMLAVVIQMSDLSAAAKQTLETSYSRNFNASGAIDAAKLSGSSELQANWKTFMETASKLSKVTVTFESKGGAGIPDALKVAVGPDATRIDAILSALQSVGPSFSQSTSAPTKYLLVSNTVFGVKSKVVDASKLDTLNSYYLQLAKVDYALSRIDAYSNNYPALVPVYQTDPKVLSVRAYRKQLLAAIEGCALRDECDYQPPKTLGLLFVEDILIGTDVQLRCLYTTYGTPDGKIRLNVLRNAAVVLTGNARLTSHVGLNTAILSRLGPISNPARPIVTKWQSISLKEDAKTDTARIIAQIDNQIFSPDVTVDVGGVRISNEDQQRSVLQDMLHSVYAVDIQADNGMVVKNTVGPPYGEKCPFTIPVK
jgi:hypothetical protein